jgi:hypothetical protein
MRGVAVFVLLGLVACAAANGVTAANAASELRQWQTTAGKPPSKAEFAAVLAACEDRVKSSGGGPIDWCLADLGLRRVQ